MYFINILHAIKVYFHNKTCDISLEDGASQGCEASVDGGQGGGNGESVGDMSHQ